MIVASKILTVSYGTFSCTLEGFDEPFNTMKAIAEYFRDLAADDRYFGAEPPVPDAAMLHRIAEREIQRRVEAKIQDNGNGVTLRVEDTPAAVVAEPVRQPASQPAPVAAAPAPRPVLMPEAAPAVESAAARLSRLRAEALVRPVPAPMPAVFDTYDEEDAPFIGDMAAFAPTAAVIDDAELAPEPVAEPSAEPEIFAEPETVAAETLAAAEQPDLRAAEASVGDVIEAEPAQVLFEAEPDETAVSDQALLDTIAGLSFDAAPRAPMAAAPVATPADPVLMETLSGLIGDAEPMLAEPEPVPELAPEPTEAEAFEPEAAAEAVVEPAPEAQPEPEPEAVDAAAMDAAAPVAQPSENSPSEKLQRARARVIRVRRVEPTRPVRRPTESGADVAQDEPTEAVAEAAAEPLVLTLQPQAELLVPEPALAVEAVELSPEAEAQLAAELAALELEAAPQGAELAPMDLNAAFDDLDDADFGEAAVVAEDGFAEDALSAAEMADADLALGLAAEEEEAEAAEDDPELVDAAAMAVADADATDSVVEETGTEAPVSEAAVSRLIEQTNTQLEVPETKRRRSAIEHLKAAVRATLAERKVNPRGEEVQAEERTDPYRRDLTRVVGPVTTAPVVPAQRSGDKPPPLVLVSAQRIDRRTDAPAPILTPVQSTPPALMPVAAAQVPSPIRPRRISHTGLAVDTIMSGFDEEDAIAQPSAGNIFDDAARVPFPEFIERVGATALPELLEAAAAYNAVMLDRPEFPRQTLFKQLEDLGAMDQPSREDGLRSFGKLLREGRIVKTQRGQFGLPEESAALSEAKRVIG